MAAEVDARWFSRLTSTAAVDRPAAEAAMRDSYIAAGFTAPSRIVWCDSPVEATWAVALLLNPTHPGYAPLVAAARRSRTEKPTIERIEARLCAMLDATSMDAARAGAGAALGMTLQFPPTAAGFQAAILPLRMQVHGDDISALFNAPDETRPLVRLEQNLFASTSAVLSSGTTGGLISASVLSDYPLSQMADDEAASSAAVPPLLSALWRAGAAASLWWPFARVVVALERPTELHVNGSHVVHRADGPAVVYRDGTRVYAWNGKAVPEGWILNPGAVPPAKIRGFDPTFRTHVEASAGARNAAKPRSRLSSLWSVDLPADVDARVEALRAHAGALPLYERYLAGEHQLVWAELVALGPVVREDPHAADAMAVALETMRRVDSNVRTLAVRLQRIGYRFAGRPHTPPPAAVAKFIRRLEQQAGTLPLSLRAFYEIVGAVDFTGTHAVLASPRSAIAADPLLVYGVEDALDEVESSDDEDVRVVTIAPDDLHKANTSGGDPYEIALPELRADAPLLNERHDLFFVDYLRLACRFGGFPGFEGVDDQRAADVLAELAAGLTEF